jgi:hypothetical protein
MIIGNELKNWNSSIPIDIIVFPKFINSQKYLPDKDTGLNIERI